MYVEVMGSGRTWFEAVVTAKSLRTVAFSIELVTTGVLSTCVSWEETVEAVCESAK